MFRSQRQFNHPETRREIQLLFEPLRERAIVPKARDGGTPTFGDRAPAAALHHCMFDIEKLEKNCLQLHIMAYTVCRIQKIKDWGTLAGSELHTTRERNTPNANPAVHNIRLIGQESDPDLVTMFKAYIGNQKIRSNAVLGVEFVLSASAEYFRPDDPSIAGTYNQKRLDDFAQATTKWLKQSWGDRVVRCELHLDEATPHIHAYLVPLDERGKLNCRALFGGTRKRLSELQDSFAAAVAHLGIDRGIKGSTAKHTKVKEY